MKLTLKKLLLIQLIACLLAWNVEEAWLNTGKGKLGCYVHNKYGPVKTWYAYVLLDNKINPILDVRLPNKKSLRLDKRHGISYYNDAVKTPLENLDDWLVFKLW
jgi:hypothetical protein